MQQPPDPSPQFQPQSQWQQQNTSWGSPPQWQQYESPPPQSQYPQQMLPPPQQWQQQPYYPPSFQPPEKPRSTFKLGMGIGCGIMLAVAIAIVVLAILVSIGRQNSTTQQQFATQTTSVPTKTIFKVGDTATNTLWSVTVNSAKEVTSGSYTQPGAGNILLVVDVTTQNLSSSLQVVSSGASFTLKDTTGQVYEEKFTGIGVPPDNSSLQPNDKLRGQIFYEVPKNLHDFTFQFQGNLLDGNPATWAVTI